MTRPPRLAARILTRALGDDPAAPTILGDLHEDFARVVETRGARAARLWYWREALGLAAGRAVHRLARAARSGAARPALAEDALWALRALRRAPGFSLFTAAVVGVGVAAPTTVFSVAKPLAFDLPFDDAHELVWIANVAEAGDSSLSAVTSRIVNLVDFRARTSSFQGLTGYDAFFARRAYTLGGDGRPERLVGVGVAHDFLDVLGVEPMLGRSFTAEEGREGGPAAVVLTHDFWRTRLAAAPGVVGRTVVLNDVPRTVVGVLPPGFDFASAFAPGADVDVLLPFPVSPDAAFQGNVLAMIGRLRPGVTPEAAQAELSALVAALQDEDPRRWGLGADLVTLREHLAGPFADSFLLLAAAAGTLLLIVCVNVSSMFLARAPARLREMAVRKAMGAPRGRLVRQLVLEALGVAAAGGAAGSALAWAATGAVRSAAGVRVPLLDAARVDGAALAVAAGLALLTGVVAGSVPALRVAEGGEADVLRAASAGGGGGGRARRLREALVAAQVTLACALLVVVGLLTTSFRAVLDVDLGFDPSGAVAWQLRPSAEFASHAEETDFYARLMERVRATPGVSAAGLVDALPLGRNRSWAYRVVDRPVADDASDAEAFPHVVDPGYLGTLRIPLMAGRGIVPADGADAPRVIVLNETGARTVFGGATEALGRRLRFWGPWEWEVVGVARDVRHLSPEMGPGVEVYFPLAQMPDVTTMDLVVRSDVAERRVAAAVAATLEDVDPGMPARESWSVASTVREAVSGRRFALGILAAFGGAALLLAGLGIYGVLSRSVAERRAEIGIRIALGASPPEVVAGVLRRMVLLTAGGIAAGWGLSLLASRLLDSVLFGVGPVDAAAFLGTAAVLLVVAVVAALVPARRAASTEAATVLRSS